MGTRAKEIIGANTEKTIELLNKAFADEWLAYYQYWIGAKIVAGPMRMSVITELEEHASDELRHAQMLSDRIIQLGGKPILAPQEWFKMSNCGYATPSDPFVKEILKQNISGEQCAIDVYDKILKATKDSDPVTYNMALEIFTDEVEHEEDLESLLEDINLIK